MLKILGVGWNVSVTFVVGALRYHLIFNELEFR